MDHRYEAFIAVAESLSMAKAAREKCVSHQCISSHIKSLEQLYKVRLFTRKPKLALTVEGEILLSRLYEMRRLEYDTMQAVSGNCAAARGKVSIGIPASRYNPLAPAILSAVMQISGEIQLEILSDYSDVLAEQVEKGIVDMAITLFQPESIRMSGVYLGEERFFLLTTAHFLRRFCGVDSDTAACGMEKGVSLQEIAAFPIVQYPPPSRLRAAIDAYAAMNGISYQTVFTSNRCDIFPAIVGSETAACILPHMYRSAVERENRLRPAENPLLMLPLDLSPLSLQRSTLLIYRQNSIMTTAKAVVIRAISSVFTDYGAALRE